MQAKKSGLLGSLFKKKKPAEGRRLTLPEAIAGAAGACFSGLSGATSSFAAEQLTFDGFRGAAAAVKQGYLLNFYGQSEQFDFSYFFPEAFVLALLEALRRRDASYDQARAARELIEAAAASLPAGLFNESVEGAPIPFAAFPKKYEAKHHEELLWRAASCRIYRLSSDAGAGRDCFFVLIDEERAEGLSDPSEPDRAKPALAEPRRLSLGSPRELVAGGFALPPRVKYGGYTAEALFDSIDAAPEAASYRAAPGVWIKMSCGLTPAAAAGKPSPPVRPWTGFLFFPTADAAKAAQLQSNYTRLAGVFLKEELEYLKKALGAAATAAAVASGAKPELEAGTGFIALKGCLAIGENRLACEAFIDLETWRWLGRLFRDPWELDCAARAGAEPALSLLLSLNQSLLRRQIGSFHRRFVDLGPQGELLPFGVFLDLLNERDARIILQNHVLQRLGPAGLRSLFCHAQLTKDSSGGETVRIATPRAYDPARLKAVLPRASIEDWMAVDPARLGSAADLAARTADMLKSIHDAIKKGRLLVSPKAGLILEKMFLPGLRAETKIKLEQAVKSNLPFATLKTMSRPILQQFLNRVGDRALSLALAGSAAELALVRANISKKRYERLAEELSLTKIQLQTGALDEEEVLAEKERIEREARGLLEGIAKKAGEAPAEAPGLRRKPRPG